MDLKNFLETFDNLFSTGSTLDMDAQWGRVTANCAARKVMELGPAEREEYLFRMLSEAWERGAKAMTEQGKGGK